MDKSGARAEYLASVDVEKRRRELWAEFQRAVTAGIDGDYSLCKAICARVLQNHGQEVADRQKRELWACIRAKRP